MLWWLPGVGVAVLVGLVVVFVVWVVRSHLQDRRRARALAQLAAQYWQTAKQTPLPAVSEPTPTLEPPGQPTDAEMTTPMSGAAGAEPERGRRVTVGELVARIEGEGLAVRLRWEEGDDGEGNGSDREGWPTGVLRRVEDPD